MLRLNMAPTTLTPFLYQTRTLSRFPTCRLILAASLHTTAVRCRAPRIGPDDHIPFQLPPDFQHDLAPDPHTSDSVTPSERQVFEKIFREISDKGLVARVRQGDPLQQQQQQQQQQTPKKKVFAKATQAAEPPLEKLMSNLEDTMSTSARKGKPQLAIQAIMASAAATTSVSKQEAPFIRGPLGGGAMDAEHHLSQSHSASDREAALMRFPPTLRRAARTALGLLEPAPVNHLAPGASEPVPDGTDPVEYVAKNMKSKKLAIQVDLQRRAELLRIRALMRAAKTDFDLWKVVEQQVFRLVERLGITEPAPPPPKPEAKKAGKRGKSKKNAEDESAVSTFTAESSMGEEEEAPALQTTPDIKQGDLATDVYGPLFPQLLYEALDLLGNKYSRPSPYTFHLLPRIKELGMTSYVLGVSTAFYNSLMEIMWDRFGDAHGVIGLMEEMRQYGLYFDKKTQGIITKIHGCYSEAQLGRGEGARFTQVLMGQPEYEPLVASKLTYWAMQIEMSIMESEEQR